MVVLVKGIHWGGGVWGEGWEQIFVEACLGQHPHSFSWKRQFELSQYLSLLTLGMQVIGMT